MAKMHNYFVIETTEGDDRWFTVRRYSIGSGFLCGEDQYLTDDGKWSKSAARARRFEKRGTARWAMLAIAKRERADRR